MKKTHLKNAVFASLFLAGVCFTTSCGKSNQNEGEMDATEANGDIYGTDGPTDNRNSGSAAGTGTTNVQTASDTVQGTTTNGNTTGTGSGTGTNDGSTGY